MVSDGCSHRLTLIGPHFGRALLLSLIFHIFLFSSIELGYRLGFWQRHLFSPSSFRHIQDSEHPIVVELQKSVIPPQERQLTFIDVSPAQAAASPPKEANFYSSRNSHAANRDTAVDSNVPKVEGKQDKVPKTTDTPRAIPRPTAANVAQEQQVETLQPLSSARPSTSREERSDPAIKPIPPSEKGDLAFSKLIKPPDTSNLLDGLTATRESTMEPPPRKSHPRKLALVQPSDMSEIAGEKMKQAGGVRRFGIESSFDVRATEFGAYDAAIVAAIQKHWYDLLDRELPRNQTGKVVLEFHLTSDGRITNMLVRENEVAPLLALLCQRAVQDPAPYAQWPDDLRRLVGKDFREVRFIFHYN